ncbi:MAG: hypothetical protein HQM08_28620 [Candidatus Riflebacteria bacterium]|nr:hypothetical protein [Candidatus Riflebacteria bacterium]
MNRAVKNNPQNDLSIIDPTCFLSVSAMAQEKRKKRFHPQRTSAHFSKVVNGDASDKKERLCYRFSDRKSGVKKSSESLKSVLETSANTLFVFLKIKYFTTPGQQ